MAPQPLVTLDGSASQDEVSSILTRDGAVIIKDFMPPSLLKETMAALEPHFAATVYDTQDKEHVDLGKLKGVHAAGTKRVYSLVPKIPDQMVAILRTPHWRATMERHLTHQYASYMGDALLTQRNGILLAESVALRLMPGAKAQSLHRDQVAYHITPDPANPLAAVGLVACLIAGSRCTRTNGATAVIPGSHLWGLDRAPRPEECTFAEMEAGSALLLLGSTYHGGGENRSAPGDADAERTLICAFGQKDNMRQLGDVVLSTPLEIARKLPEDIQKICGYWSGIGWIGDHMAPIEFMKTGKSTIGMFNEASAQSMRPRLPREPMK